MRTTKRGDMPQEEMGECARCHEPISAWVWVSNEPWCHQCADTSSELCSVCNDHISSREILAITQGDESSFVCETDLLVYSLGRVLSPARKLVSR